ncbi:PTS fructose transporter subunit IIABC [Nesterenkonia muleiensis]|uniref:PTS fructose transporter subunit IIABC n=1 Tax=Nesterenkonia muleiensis TaxID=2282648 RepID=UPI000E7088A5|nr:fructose-specific PTS transporter subunit EIIC [Nesterenkonia muleiensis]
MSIITEDLVSLESISASSPHKVITALAELIATAGRAGHAASLASDAWAREQTSATGMASGIAIPHCKTSAVEQATVAFARLQEPVDFGAPDGPADLIFFIAAPAGASEEHLTILSALASSLIDESFLAELREASDAQEIVALIENSVSPDQPQKTPDETPSATSGEPASARRRLVAVTACPTGIAHTYMAADALKRAAESLNVDLQVETQGSSGAAPLPPEAVQQAEAVIFAADVDVRDKHRFAGKPVVAGRVKRGINEPGTMITQALSAADDPQAERVAAGTSGEETAAEDSGESFGRKTQRVLMTGVSYMIPFVAAGGLLMALGFLLGGYNITDVAGDVVIDNTLWNLPTEADLPDDFVGWGPLGAYLGSVFFAIGDTAMSFLVPALAGYIAYGMADRPGIAPGFIAGAVAEPLMEAGFIGGIIGGLLAGAVASWFRTFEVPRWLAGLMPVVIIPLVATIVAAGLMLMLLGGPIASLTSGLENWLSGMTGAAAVVLGLILGLMMCVDLGGPINKVAYAFAVAGLSGAVAAGEQAPLVIMATVMAAGMVPPLGMALATFVDRRLFSRAEQENGKTAVLLGAAFISEGAIPFAAADPLRVLPSAMLGGMATGALTMAFSVTSYAPHGGVFVFFAIDNFLLFILSVLIGTAVTALSVIALKRWARKTPVAESTADQQSTAPETATV